MSCHSNTSLSITRRKTTTPCDFCISISFNCILLNSFICLSKLYLNQLQRRVDTKMFHKVKCHPQKDYTKTIQKWPSFLSAKCFTLDEPLKPNIDIPKGMLIPYQSLDLTVPDSYDWTVEEVLEWLRNVVQLPQYAETFIFNRIDGESLLFLNASTLPKMCIRRFDHIKHITWHIRELFQIDFPLFKDSISLPRAEVLKHLILYHRNKEMLEKLNISKEEFLKRFIYHYPEYKIDLNCKWNLIDPAYYLKAAKTVNCGTSSHKEKTFIVNEEYKFDLTKKKLRHLYI